MSLNAAQREAVQTRSGPLLVLAGAGTGKTRVVTYRIAELIRTGVAPSRILAVTFTKKAAGEMQQRASELLGRRKSEKPEISTFHSLCVRVLRRHITRLGFPDRFVIYDRGDQETIARQVLREIKVPAESLRPADLLATISRWKSASIRPEQAAAVAETDKEHLASMAYRRYQNALMAAAAVDFDDLLLCTEALFTQFDDVRAEEARRFDHLLIDEYQDTNSSQYQIVKGLAREHRNLCVVGDDDQSIYGWRGAEVTHILQFTRDWPDAKVVRLEENYRSVAPILQMANRLIAFNKQRHDKRLRAANPGGDRPRILKFQDDITEARTIVGEMRAKIVERAASARDFAILFRTNEQTRAFEMELRRVGLPYVVIGGMSFYDRKEVRDVLAYLKVLSQPRDEVSLRRIINNPPRGIGATTVAKLNDAALAQGKPLCDALGEAALHVAPAAAQAVKAFVDLMARTRRRAERGPLAAMVTRLLSDIGYEQELARIYKNANERAARWNAVQETVNAVAAYVDQAAHPSLDGFLQETSINGPDERNDKESKLQRDAVVLMTLHSAKGLEFPQVYLVGLEEGLLPHRRSLEIGGGAIEEERRLCYVGVTRAQVALTITLSLARLKWGKLRPTKPSRFLFEMTGRADNPHKLVATKKRKAATPKKRKATTTKGKVAAPKTARSGKKASAQADGASRRRAKGKP